MDACARLGRLGIPVDVLDRATRATPDRRRAARRRAARALQGVVLPDQAPPGLPPAELAALHSYEQRFGIRQLDASVTATPAVGLTEPTDTVGYSGPGSTAVRRSSPPRPWPATSAYTRGPVPFSDDEPGVDESWVQLARRGPASCRC